MTVTLNVGPRMARAAEATFKFQLVNDQLFTPLLAYVSILNTLASYEREFGAATFAVQEPRAHQGARRAGVRRRVHRRHADRRRRRRRCRAAHDPARQRHRAGRARGPRPRDRRERAAAHASTIERVWLDDVRPRAGRTVPLKVLTRTYRGEEMIATVPIEIPANARARCRSW